MTDTKSTLLAYLKQKPDALEDYPFDDQVLVLKVHGKMFALFTEKEGVARVNLKCDPFHAQELRDIFDCVQPGYHMNKKHWNTVILDGSLPEGELRRMVDHSYALVVKGLTKAKRTNLELRFDHQALYGKNDETS
ncbi:MmcQ/YjbR family DNA-binding protein [Marinomonas piezotolerans]|uniref:MmcQ/YjbR family DNA-binding protein n=1 Tax=Marinomonas piezotolerans TaxID=2213058 RepID=A0A370U5Q2_9GAMM|nr:MmcQ/YjbR family DNA-binding protein [Marinomonas piezotolerans]RDL43104.1 MmcQ/YjbR family DNA-binding protein [Marinomonas piezotolerans]